MEEKLRRLIERSRKLTEEEKNRMLEYLERGEFYQLGMLALAKGLRRIVSLLKRMGYLTNQDIRSYMLAAGRMGAKRYISSMQEYHRFVQEGLREMIKRRGLRWF